MKCEFIFKCVQKRSEIILFYSSCGGFTRENIIDAMRTIAITESENPRDTL